MQRVQRRDGCALLHIYFSLVNSSLYRDALCARPCPRVWLAGCCARPGAVLCSDPPCAVPCRAAVLSCDARKHHSRTTAQTNQGVSVSARPLCHAVVLCCVMTCHDYVVLFYPRIRVSSGPAADALSLGRAMELLSARATRTKPTHTYPPSLPTHPTRFLRITCLPPSPPDFFRWQGASGSFGLKIPRSSFVPCALTPAPLPTYPLPTPYPPPTHTHPYPQEEHRVGVTPEERQLLDWHLANLEYANAGLVDSHCRWGSGTRRVSPRHR